MFLKQKDMIANVILINHERIDLRQQLELLVLPFYLIYFIILLFLMYYQNIYTYINAFSMYNHGF